MNLFLAVFMHEKNNSRYKSLFTFHPLNPISEEYLHHPLFLHLDLIRVESITKSKVN